ncbi:jg22107 [Pararge aegeria aegeria]|uniref:Jg22107 protein n=1 Tax=Pararge aegeria aegeria TaxID=348720 RepID=A0A8S4QKB7_9NEOP|nr:jg22107 [Pararge aegeria aegeria]
MGEQLHKTCVRVNSADDDDETRDEVDHELPKKNPFVRIATYPVRHPQHTKFGQLYIILAVARDFACL